MKEIDAEKFKEIVKRGMEHLFQERDCSTASMSFRCRTATPATTWSIP